MSVSKKMERARRLAGPLERARALVAAGVVEQDRVEEVAKKLAQQDRSGGARSYRDVFQRLCEEISEHVSEDSDCPVLHLEQVAQELEKEVTESLEPDDSSFVWNRLNYAMHEYCCVGPAPRVIRAVGQALAAMGQRGLEKESENATTKS